MNPLNANNLSYLKAQAIIPSRLAVKEIAIKKWNKYVRWSNGRYEMKSSKARTNRLKNVLKAKNKGRIQQCMSDSETVNKLVGCKKHRLGVEEKPRVEAIEVPTETAACRSINNIQFAWDLLSSTKTSLGRMRLLSFFGRMSKIFFYLPKNDIVWVSQKSQVPFAYQVKKSWKWIIRGGIVRPRSHSSHYSPRSWLLLSATY